jgi:glycosyltransferase involved in cell wall biosynthesis
VIVDDLSTDDTWEVIKKLKPDKAVQVESKGYAAGARNKGMEFYKGDTYTMWLDDDDILIDDEVFQ